MGKMRVLIFILEIIINDKGMLSQNEYMHTCFLSLNQDIHKAIIL